LLGGALKRTLREVGSMGGALKRTLRAPYAHPTRSAYAHRTRTVRAACGGERSYQW